MPVTKSPLRYPGGKTQLYKFVSNLIKANQITSPIYIEPFSGGAGVAIELLLNNDVKQVVLNDFDKSIYSLWRAILSDTDNLINLIDKTPVTIKSWRKQNSLYKTLYNEPYCVEKAFATLFLNRTNRSGIINAGPIGGHEQKGPYTLDCRFNKKNIINKIERIAEQKHRIDLYNKDAINLISIIEKNYLPQNSFIFFDPPYYKQGNKLYTNFYIKSDHRLLFESIMKLEEFHWITTYDYSSQIYDIYNHSSKVQKYKYDLAYSAQTKRKASELMFASSKTKLSSFDKVQLQNLC